MLSRRSFIASAIALSASTEGGARERIVRSGPPRFRIGLAAYSWRPHFRFMKGRPQKFAGEPFPNGLTMDGFLDYCVLLNVEAAELTSYFLAPGDGPFPSDESLRSLRQSAFLRGVTISGTAIGNDFTIGRGPRLDAEVADAKRWIDKAAVLGAPHIRFFAGTAAQLAASPTAMPEAIESINDCAVLAAEKGIFIGVENHGGVDADQMLQIMDAAESPWVGINLDTGNFLADDPYDSIRRCAPFAVNVQVKTMMKDSSGRKFPADLERVAGVLKDSGYQGFVILEYEEDDRVDGIPRAMDALRSALA